MTAPPLPTPVPSPRRRRARPPRTAVLLALALLAGACGPAATPTPESIRVTGPDGRPVRVPPAALTAAAAAPTDDPFDPGTFAERGEFPLPDSTRPAGYEGYSWQHLLDDAAGTTVRFGLRAADPPLAWIDEWVVDVAAGRYGIDVVTATFATHADLVARIADDAAGVADGAAGAAGRDGALDLFWLDDAGYGALHDAGRLYGPWTSFLPSRRYLDPDDRALGRSYGVDVAGDAMPWGRAQLVLLHDAERLPAPPASWDALWAWIDAHPGRFAVPAPPDATGRAFVRSACVALAADPAAFAKPPPPDAAATVLAPCLARLAAAAPSLHGAGGDAPASGAAAEALLAAGDVDLTVRDGPPTAVAGAGAPGLPPTTRAAVLAGGTLDRAHFLAIPSGAANKAGAIVLANFLLSPEAQYAKRVAENWGDRTVVTLSLIPEHWRAGFAEADAVEPAVPPDRLAAQRLAEPSAAWAAAIDAAWQAALGGGAGGAP